MSRFWRVALRVQYKLLALLDPLIVIFWRRFGIGITVALEVPHRSGGGVRSRLVGLLRAGDREYVGHPNGHVGWTRDLAAAGKGTLVWPNGMRRAVSAALLEHGPEREAAILATGQQPFPGNLVYRLARGHIRAVGVYFRLEG